MRFLSKKEVLAITGVADATLKRWENAGLFPRRVPLGPVHPTRYAKTGRSKSYNCRVGWPEEEVRAWYEAKLASRDGMLAPPSTRGMTNETKLALVSPK
jgi:predicted DNA-binding transcriptional regulator AlpA